MTQQDRDRGVARARAPRAHPSPGLLSGYATGLILWPAELCVGVHLDGCPQCRDEVAAQRAKDEALIAALPEAPTTPDEVDRLTAGLDAAEVEVPRPPIESLAGVRLPPALAACHFARRRRLSPQFWVAHLPEARRSGWRAYLLHAPAGLRLPQHGHSGSELICVLEGSFTDRLTYAAGDFVEGGDEDHVLTVGPDRACVCLIATEGPTRWTGWGAIASRYLDI